MVKFWLSFSFDNFQKKKVNKDLDFINNKDRFYIFIFGIFGGIITSIFGSGVDIFTFCLATLFFNLSEKIATPTSVILMTIITIIGFFLHAFILKDFKNEEFNYWITAIPVVLIFAPIGAFLINLIKRKLVASFLILIIVLQFFSALFILNPFSFSQIILTVATILFGFSFFFILYKKRKQN